MRAGTIVVKLFCPWCEHKGIYEKIVGGGKQNVSQIIGCEKCGRYLNHKTRWE